ncbi:MAG: DUF2828 family protein, partial [Endomicrobiaceae bacterium]|nr:DUF2828 family protein [Endomicrobiaceae bacterium]
MAFINNIKKTLDDEYNYSVTENGALGYRTTGKELLDLNFSVASLRSATEDEIATRFESAFYADREAAMRWLFYARDVRGGLGERRLFRVVMEHLALVRPEMVKPVISLIPEYGRYDDLWCLLDCKNTKRDVIQFIDTQLKQDYEGWKAKKPISLLAKWLPSVNASSATTKHYAHVIFTALKMTERDYRKMLSALRKYIDVVEVKMSGKRWEEIKYESVPSRANLIYNDAFLRNDEYRRRDFLARLEKGETKINAGTLYPHDIVHKYNSARSVDSTLEGLWKALPDTVKGNGNTIVVADGSGSMTCTIGNTNVSALSVANALAIYFAERSSGEFKDKYITFSERPQLVDLAGGKTLRDKIRIALGHNEVANTNIEAVFDLILTTAVKHKMSQEDIPANILIISDMEFDSCATSGVVTRDRW